MGQPSPKLLGAPFIQGGSEGTERATVLDRA